tara:strand:- start:3204 stop:3566 length:363 start_codon:yes stop_codon:yes gene_type:complete
VKNKTYIAAILAFLFLAKFFAIDANGLNILFGGDEITFIKPSCKKENSSKLGNNTMDFSQVDSESPQEILMRGFCNSQFQFELYTWETTFLKFIPVFNEHSPSNLSYRYLDNDSPPPRLV